MLVIVRDHQDGVIDARESVGDATETTVRLLRIETSTVSVWHSDQQTINLAARAAGRHAQTSEKATRQ
ncbi:MAG: hypothetical protein KDJ36_08230 [Hyphomicrobiaceae bacterium]|nr:hypothetical protein [Hyphomicrobiaceae bacterium]